MDTNTETGKQLTVADRAAAILKFDERKAQLAELAKGSARIVAITNPDGYKECHSARMTLKNMRVAIEKLGKEARDDANAFSKAVIAKEKELIGMISPEESRLQALQDEHDAARAAELAERARQERERVEAEQRALQGIRDLPLLMVGKPSAAIDLAINNLLLEDFLASIPEAVRDQARALVPDTVEKLTALRDERVAAEAETKRLADERAELDRQRKQQEAEQAERDRAAREQRERDDATRAAELKRQQDELAEQRKQFEADQEKLRAAQAEQRQREQEEADRKAAAERQRLDDEARAAREAEAQRLAEARQKHLDTLRAGAPALRVAAIEARALLVALGQAENDVTITLGFAIEKDAAKPTTKRRAA